MQLLEKMLAMVARFQMDVIGITIPAEPTPLPKHRVEARADHFKEEDVEFVEAEDIVDQADALLDGIYLRLGALVEMGVLPGPTFDAVHEKNMLKKRGAVAKRPKAIGHDAMKPEGWTPPDLFPFMTIGKGDIDLIMAVRHGLVKVVANEAA